MSKYKYEFAGPNFVEEKIVTRRGATVGFIRIKPVSVLWKPANEQLFYSVGLDDFIGWITSKETDAARTTR